MKVDLKTLIGNRILLVVVLAASFYLGASTVRVIARNWQLQQEIATLRSEIELLSAENERLTYDIEYYKTDQYLEQAARRQLNLKASGESVTIVGDTNQQVVRSDSNIDQTVEPSKSNWQSWIDFLLARK